MVVVGIRIGNFWGVSQLFGGVITCRAISRLLVAIQVIFIK